MKTKTKNHTMIKLYYRPCRLQKLTYITKFFLTNKKKTKRENAKHTDNASQRNWKEIIVLSMTTKMNTTIRNRRLRKKEVQKFI